MWQTKPTDEFARRLKQFHKKHPRETRAMLDNLDTYVGSLRSGIKPLQVRHGFIHPETHGAVALDQKGTPGKPTPTRLYVYADPDTNLVHLITVGDKHSQRDDIASCREFVVGLREEQQNAKDEPDAGPAGGADGEESNP